VWDWKTHSRLYFKELSNNKKLRCFLHKDLRDVDLWKKILGYISDWSLIKKILLNVKFVRQNIPIMRKIYEDRLVIIKWEYLSQHGCVFDHTINSFVEEKIGESIDLFNNQFATEVPAYLSSTMDDFCMNFACPICWDVKWLFYCQEWFTGSCYLSHKLGRRWNNTVVCDKCYELNKDSKWIKELQYFESMEFESKIDENEFDPIDLLFLKVKDLPIKKFF